MKNKNTFFISLLVCVILISAVYISKSIQSLGPSIQTAQVIKPTQTIKFKISKGWNLVSFGVMTYNDCSIEDLLVVYGYDPIEKRYIKIKDITEVDSGKGILDYIEKAGFYEQVEGGDYLTRTPANSGWLYCASTDCGMITEVPPEFSLKTIKAMGLRFPAGWNFFTVMPDMWGKSIDEIRGDCLIEKAYMWNSENQTWLNMQEQTFPETVVGHGIIIKTSNDCSPGENIVIPGVPPLPE